MRAGVVETTSTQRAREISPAFTPWKIRSTSVLDPGHAVGDLGEVPDAQLLLLLEAERAVVGRDDAQVVGAQPAPEVGLVGLAGRSGGEQTNFAPSKPSRARSASERNRYCGQVSAKTF